MKKLPSKYYMDVVDGKLVITEPYKKVQKPAPQPVLVEAALPDAAKNECRQCKKGFTPGSLRGAPQVFCTVKCRTKYHNQKNFQRHKSERKEAYEGRVCPQCSTKLEYQSRGRSKKFCAAECRETWFNNKYKQERRERLAKTSPRTISCDHIAPVPAASQYIPCKECNNTFLKGRVNQVFSKGACRIQFFVNKYLPEKVTGTFVTEVNKALALLPPEKKLPPIPEDTSAACLLAAGRTLTVSGLVEAVQNTYGIDVAEERPRPKAYWFAILLARHSKTLEEWKKLLGKHGMLSNPKIEKWLLFQAGASSPAAAGRLKAQLGI